jgi:uncharacterized protein (DUF983 family)
MAAAVKPGWGTFLWRGLRKRCPNCGAKGIFRGWFRMEERCPQCGMKFEREEGFFAGAVFVNLALAEFALFAFIVVAFAVTLPDPPTVAIAAGGVVIAVLLPIVMYPYSKSVWAAIHLGMTPLDPDEQADAAAWRFERGEGAA